ncbi:DNA cytosine methyltransferase [Aristaeella lactis]|uniref:DNA (Cytosine-5)-methyltransferase 1 n=1 Tax=Aristaeella lactis TaxID=3046383 RepID=A0AC61PL76_9FIRM|nr:DNA cytosine methyltransferase [Aristaeella lactis]QUA52192.1 DNA cytosine methyltransferase [Aristaeella lactis]SMC58644.1 DNA (cytosine-5)-methyltransferase 1 [Aristaeella lactis]
MNVIDLFCGCGGFSCGFAMAGFNTVLGIDMWNDAIVTFLRNHPDAKAINEDITKVSADELLKVAGKEAAEIDVIIGGPPCQGFSISGKRLIDDPRNKLYKSFVDIVSYIQPKVFVMENVPGLISMGNGAVKAQVVEDFEKAGYIVETKVLTASDYGVPQSRRRVFFVGINPRKILNTERFAFPEPTHGDAFFLQPYVTCEDALSDLDFVSETEVLPEEIDYQMPPKTEYQRMMRENSPKLHNHSITIHTQKTRSIIAMVPDGGNYKSLPKELWQTRKVHIAWTRMNSKKPCFTIDTGHNHHFHYHANRVPTVRESARLQSFPDSYEFIGIKTSQLKQVGNAVPPLLAKAIAEEVGKVIIRG